MTVVIIYAVLIGLALSLLISGARFAALAHSEDELKAMPSSGR